MQGFGCKLEKMLWNAERSHCPGRRGSCFHELGTSVACSDIAALMSIKALLDVVAV